MSYVNCRNCMANFNCQQGNRKRSCCDPCSFYQLEEKDAELTTLRSELQTLKKVRSDVDTVRSRLQFLRLQMELDGIFTGDVRIVVKGNSQVLSAHKYVLSSRSSVFCKMFEAKMLEEETGMVVIDDASQDVVRAVIQFCYDAEIEFTDGVTAEEVLAVAHKYDIALLQKICEENLITTIGCENLPKILKIAVKFKLTCLELAASQFFKEHFDIVIAKVLAEAF